jgi:beta-lactamase regulating signal transducer with metallopeptidase domain
VCSLPQRKLTRQNPTVLLSEYGKALKQLRRRKPFAKSILDQIIAKHDPNSRSVRSRSKKVEARKGYQCASQSKDPKLVEMALAASICLIVWHLGFFFFGFYLLSLILYSLMASCCSIHHALYL